ncbi:CHAT domain-containing protein [Mycena maculata]|uniref:CHAT domain-containing protein n=1 Tax=Mycena maculata TaxID=230809 RepID=A0AAD7H8M0_9AGAR|nr:CHAT domain-containing protein [Mycena maculata]
MYYHGKGQRGGSKDRHKNDRTKKAKWFSYWLRIDWATYVEMNSNRKEGTDLQQAARTSENAGNWEKYGNTSSFNESLRLIPPSRTGRSMLVVWEKSADARDKLPACPSVCEEILRGSRRNEAVNRCIAQLHIDQGPSVFNFEPSRIKMMCDRALFLPLRPGYTRESKSQLEPRNWPGTWFDRRRNILSLRGVVGLEPYCSGLEYIRGISTAGVGTELLGGGRVFERFPRKKAVWRGTEARELCHREISVASSNIYVPLNVCEIPADHKLEDEKTVRDAKNPEVLGFAQGDCLQLQNPTHRRSQGSSALTCFLSAALIYAVELLGSWNNGTPEADSPNLDPNPEDAGYIEDVGAVVKMLADEERMDSEIIVCLSVQVVVSSLNAPHRPCHPRAIGGFQSARTLAPWYLRSRCPLESRPRGQAGSDASGLGQRGRRGRSVTAARGCSYSDVRAHADWDTPSDRMDAVINAPHCLCMRGTCGMCGVLEEWMRAADPALLAPRAIAGYIRYMRAVPEVECGGWMRRISCPPLHALVRLILGTGCMCRCGRVVCAASNFLGPRMKEPRAWDAGVPSVFWPLAFPATLSICINYGYSNNSVMTSLGGVYFNPNLPQWSCGAQRHPVELSIVNNRALLSAIYKSNQKGIQINPSFLLPPTCAVLPNGRSSSQDDYQVSHGSADDVTLEAKIELSYDFMGRYEDAGDLEDLDSAIQKLEEAIDQVPPDHPDRPKWLQSLAVCFTNRYKKVGDLKDLTAAVDRDQEAVDWTPENHPDRVGRLENLAVSFSDRYQRLGELKDLETVLQCRQQTVDLTPADHPDRASRLQILAVSFSDRYQRLGELKDLEAALQKDQESVDLTPVTHPDRASRLQSLAVSFGDRYQRLGELKDLEAALQRDQESVDLTPANHPNRASRLQSLGVSFTDRYRRLGELKDLDSALQYRQQAVDLTPEDHPDKVHQLEILATLLGDRYERLGDVKDLESALQSQQQAVDLAPEDHPDRASQLHSLAVFFRDRYQRLRELKDLEAALQNKQQAVDLTPADHPDRLLQLSSLAVSFTDRYQRLGELKDLEAALQIKQQVVDLTMADHPDRAKQLQSLAVSVNDRYQRLGDLKDLQAALQIRQQAVDLTLADHPERAKRLQSLAMSFRNRYQRLGEPKDLEAALQRDQESVDLTPADHPERASRLQALAMSFSDWYNRFGEPKDLEAALKHSQQAVDLTPADHPAMAHQLQNLAMYLMARYERLGELKDLEMALQHSQQAVDLTPANHPDRASRLHALSASFTNRYRRLGELNDLETALQHSHQAVDLTPANHPNIAGRLQALAASFSDRYQRLGELKDLEAALYNSQQAVDMTPANHPDRPNQLQSLAISFTYRYQRLGALNDLEMALQHKQQAVDLTPANHPDKASRLQTLGVSFTERYQRLGELKDLEAALQKDQQSVDLTLPDHPERASRLQSLAASFTDRYQRLGDLKDLEAALQRDQESVDLTPADHPERASRLQALAMSFTDWYDRFGEPKDLEAALQHRQQAVDLTPADHPAMARRLQNLAESFIDKFKKFQRPEDLKTLGFDPEPSWRAALRWASFSKEVQPRYCSTAYSAAFNLLPELLWIGHTINVRQDAIRRLDIGKTASDATRISLTLSDPISAVQFFEQGLATTFQQMLQLRPDLDILPAKYAEKLKQLSYELYSGTSDNPSNVAHERQELLQVIRKQPNLEHFLLPQPYTVLCHASQGGSIVILNSHEDGCDGIIILNSVSDPVHVALPNVTADILQSQQTALKELLVHCGVRTRGDSASTRIFVYREGFNFRSRTIEEHFTDLLTQLWNNVVGPIYQVLASHGVHNGRLWWLPSGSFIGLPLHACSPTNQFIHSYTATLGSLLEAWTKKPSASQYKVGVVGVTHTGLQGENYLKEVEQEVRKICSVIRGPNLVCLEGEQATPAAVQNKLQSCSWIHLACHGTQDLIEPTKSRLLLYNGALELEMILKMPLPHAEFIFLAACQTAMGDAELVNESFHLGGGFIAAGFRGAIGTLWSMNDQDGPVVAETVYSHIFRDGQQPQASDAAEALQLAVNKLKTQKVPYHRWIPFIHMGV